MNSSGAAHKAYLEPSHKTHFEPSEALERIRRHWLSNVVHDLSSPLFTSRGYVGLMLEAKETPISDSQRRYLTAALEQINRIVALVVELHELPQRHDFRLSSFDFHELVEHSIKTVGSGLLAKDVRLVLTNSGGPRTTIGDRDKLGEALGSFINTAGEACNAGGILDVSVCSSEEKIILRVNARCKSPDLDSKSGLSRAFRLWRLHGGSVSSGHSSEGRYFLTCELPVIRDQE